MYPRITFLLSAVAASAAAAQADWVKYYVSTDQRSAPFNAPAGVGGGAYPDHPNFGRLTLLFDHHDSTPPHWHQKARFLYSGSAASPVLGQTTGVLQETQAVTGEWTRLQASTASDYGNAFGSDYFISKPVTGDVEDNFTIRSIESLRGFGPTDVETVMLKSSALPLSDPLAGQGRYEGGISIDSHVHIELVSVSDPALKVFIDAEGSVNPLAVNADAHVGDGNNWEFTPILALANADVPTVETLYTATFRMVDEEGIHGNSGLFSFTVAVPEPATLGLLGLGSLFLRRRR